MEDELVKALDNAGLKVATGQEKNEILAELEQEVEKLKTRRTPPYKYESKYQFPDDVDLYGSKDFDPDGFRNCIHVSVSRGMEFMDGGKDPKDFVQKEYAHIKGFTEDNDNVTKLKDHIRTCVREELGPNWGHSGFSMSMAVNHVLEAKERGWDNYIEWVRTFAARKREGTKEG